MATSWFSENFRAIKLIFLCLFAPICLLTIIKGEQIIELVDGLAHRIFTPADIAKYDGSDPAMPIFMAVKGVVFDVSAGKNFYGAGAPYNALVGKDATRAVAKMTLDEEDLNASLEGLTPDQLDSLEEIYTGVYKEKYPVVGYMDHFVRLYPEKFNPDANKANDEL
ncbi:neudesin-like [Lineus longissimus]|uniref:neudesin-like n=1 Tax=Lineus longissimus TaxID=88925 RepID=UPI002B4CD7EF